MVIFECLPTNHKFNSIVKISPKNSGSPLLFLGDLHLKEFELAILASIFLKLISFARFGDLIAQYYHFNFYCCSKTKGKLYFYQINKSIVVYCHYKILFDSGLTVNFNFTCTTNIYKFTIHTYTWLQKDIHSVVRINLSLY